MPDIVKPGVAQVRPPADILGTINSQIEKALNAMPEGAYANAVVSIETTAGINAAVVKRFNGGWNAVAWFGKRWGAPIEGGVAIQKVWNND